MHFERHGLRPILKVEAEHYGEIVTMRKLIEYFGVILVFISIFVRFTGILGSLIGMLEFGIVIFLAARLIKIEEIKIREGVGVTDEVDITVVPAEDEDE